MPLPHDTPTLVLRQQGVDLERPLIDSFSVLRTFLLEILDSQTKGRGVPDVYLSPWELPEPSSKITPEGVVERLRMTRAEIPRIPRRRKKARVAATHSPKRLQSPCFFSEMEGDNERTWDVQGLAVLAPVRRFKTSKRDIYSYFVGGQKRFADIQWGDSAIFPLSRIFPSKRGEIVTAAQIYSQLLRISCLHLV